MSILHTIHYEVLNTAGKLLEKNLDNKIRAFLDRNGDIARININSGVINQHCFNKAN